MSIDINKTFVFSSAPNFCYIILDEFISRLYRSFIFFLDNQSIWQNLQNRLDSQSRKNYFRLNIILTDKQFTIDNVNRIQELQDCIKEQSNLFQNCTNIVYAILLLFLFFELNQISIFINSVYRYSDFIRSRLNSRIILEALSRLQQSHWAVVTDKKILEYLESKQDICERCRYYKIYIEVVVRYLTNSTTVYLQSVIKKKKKISKFLQTIQ